MIKKAINKKHQKKNFFLFRTFKQKMELLRAIRKNEIERATAMVPLMNSNQVNMMYEGTNPILTSIQHPNGLPVYKALLKHPDIVLAPFMMASLVSVYPDKLEHFRALINHEQIHPMTHFKGKTALGWIFVQKSIAHYNLIIQDKRFSVKIPSSYECLSTLEGGDLLELFFECIVSHPTFEPPKLNRQIFVPLKPDRWGVDPYISIETCVPIHRIRAAAYMSIIVSLVVDGYFSCCPKQKEKKRFFDLMVKLPMDMAQLVCLRHCKAIQDVIPDNLIARILQVKRAVLFFCC